MTMASQKKQQGAILLVLFLMIFSVGTTLFLSSVSTHQVEMRQFNDVRIEMLKAKQALLAYTVNYPGYGFNNDGVAIAGDEYIGRLICPDVDNDGLADSNTTDCTDAVRGRLPEKFAYGSGNWVTLNDYFSGIDQQFWYVVDPAYKETSDVVNITNAGTLSIDGESGYIAVIIAPGEALASQNRATGPTVAANYLEQDNVSGSNFINSYPADPENFNDQVIGITQAELASYVDLKEILDSGYPDIFETYFAENGNLPTTLVNFIDYLEDYESDPAWMNEEGYLAPIEDELTGPGGSYVYNAFPYVKLEFASCASQVTYYIPAFSPSWWTFGTC